MQPAPVGGIVFQIELSDGGNGDCERDPGRGQNVFILLAPDSQFAVEQSLKQRWGKKWGKNGSGQKIIAHKKIQSPLSDWIS